MAFIFCFDEFIFLHFEHYQNDIRREWTTDNVYGVKLIVFGLSFVDFVLFEERLHLVEWFVRSTYWSLCRK